MRVRNFWAWFARRWADGGICSTRGMIASGKLEFSVEHSWTGYGAHPHLVASLKKLTSTESACVEENNQFEISLWSI